MTELSKASVWSSYQGVVQDSRKGTAPTQSHGAAGERVVQLRAIKNSRRDAMGRNSTGARTKLGLAISISILIGAFFKFIALALFLIAILLVVSGGEPQKTGEFLAGLPGGDYLIRALARIDGWLS